MVALQWINSSDRRISYYGILGIFFTFASLEHKVMKVLLAKT